MIIGKKTIHLYEAGCKVRRAGKAYLWTNMSKWRSFYPFGYFVYDPPIVVEEPSSWGLCAQGISYVWKNGYLHAFDWIGKNNYSNAADIMEEVANGWASGLLPLNDPNHIKELKAGHSKRFLFHPEGTLENPLPYQKAYQDIHWLRCFLAEDDPNRELHLQDDNPQMCASLLWQILSGEHLEGRETLVKVGEHSYTGYGPIDDHPPVMRLALNMWLPIDEIHVVEGDGMDEALKFLEENCTLPTYITEY